MTAKERIQSQLHMASKSTRREVMIRLSVPQVQALEAIAAAIAELSGQRVSRNTLIVDAVEAYIQESKAELSIDLPPPQKGGPA